MYYEIYIDSLFLVNFVMNLYLLLLVNASVYRTATRLRLVLGAVVGAVAYLIPFWLPGPVWFRTAVGILPGNILMLLTAFRIKSIKSFLLILEKLLIFSFLMGGCMVFLVKNIPVLGQYATGILGIMGIGAIIYLLATLILKRGWNGASLCKVTLVCKEGKIKVTGLIDSGNSLAEPISGKPVSVVEKSVFHGLWKDEPGIYRVIPYHSIGKKNGMLKGYLFPEIQIETCGVTKICKDVYIAVSEESISGDGIIMPELEKGVQSKVRMIVNPALLKNN